MQQDVPGAVLAAAIFTWVGSALSAGGAFFMALTFVVLLDPIFDTFEDGAADVRWSMVGATFLVVVLAALASVTAYFLLRRRRWAMWGLLVLSAFTTFVALMAAYYVWPILVSVCAAVAFVLLCLPDTRAWVRPQPVTT